MVSRHIIPGLTLLLTVHYTNVLSVHIILAIITFYPACFSQRLGDSRCREQFVWGCFGSLMGAGGHTRSEVEYMHKRRAESILTDFQFWQTVVSSKETKPRAAVVFWARQLIVSMDFIVIQAKKTVFTWYYSAAPHLPGLSGDVAVSGWIRLGEMTAPRA